MFETVNRDIVRERIGGAIGLEFECWCAITSVKDWAAVDAVKG